MSSPDHYFGRRTIEGLWALAVPAPAALIKAAIATAGGLARIHGAPVASHLVAGHPVFKPVVSLLIVFGYGVLWVGLAPLIVPPIQYTLDRAVDLTIYLITIIAGKKHGSR